MIADLSVNYVERFVLEAGYTTQRQEKDYGYDLVLFTFDGEGYAEPGLGFIQLNASETLKTSGGEYYFDLDIRDYNRWVYERDPVFLIIYDASRRRASWLDVQRYFREDESRGPAKGAKTVWVRIPARQSVGRRAMRQMRAAVRNAARQLKSEVSS